MEAPQQGEAAVFEAQRRHLTGLAYRMLGSLAEAQDVVQEAICAGTRLIVTRSPIHTLTCHRPSRGCAWII